jgi:hypothetical protein
MPWEAYRTPYGDEVVYPHDVEHGVDVFCMYCGDRMRVWRTTTREDGIVVIRHFKHLWEGESGTQERDCTLQGGGEGDPHKRAKIVAIETLKQFYPGSTIDGEGDVPDPKFDGEGARLAPEFKKDKRVGDVVLRFDTPHETFGKGIVVEIQDKNTGKNVLDVTRAYLSVGYSVCWFSLDAFGSKSLMYNQEEFESLLRGEHPDVMGVFAVDLNLDGTVPNNSWYPLSASVWPAAVDVIWETQPTVDTGWRFPAYHSDGSGRTIRLMDGPRMRDLYYADPMPPRTVIFPMDVYEMLARRMFRQTPWEELFPGQLELPIEIADGVPASVPQGYVPLGKWSAESKLARFSKDFEDDVSILENIARIVEYNTGGLQPETVPMNTIVRLSTRGTAAPEPGYIRSAIGYLVHTGRLNEPEPGRFSLRDRQLLS